MNATRHTLRRPRIGSVAASGFVLSAIVMLVGALTPGYNESTETVSRLASPGQPFALLAQAGFVLYGILVLVGAGPLGDSVPDKKRLLGGLISLYGAAALTAGLASKDGPHGTHPTASGIHVDATVLGGAAIISAMIVVAVGSPHAIARRTSTVTASLTCATALTFKVMWGSPFYGLIERVLLALPAMWLSALASTRQADGYPPAGPGFAERSGVLGV